MATVARIRNNQVVLENDPLADLYWLLRRSGVMEWQMLVHDLSRTPAGQVKLRDIVAASGPSETVRIPDYLRELLRGTR